MSIPGDSPPAAIPQAQSGVLSHSATIGKLALAVSQAQSKLRNPERNRTVTVRTRTGGEYGFRYATLDAILDLVRPVLAEAKIALVQGVRTNGKGLQVSSMLAHESGEWLESAVTFALETDPQRIGSLITYGRRYTLTGMLGIAAEEDDDANSAAGNAIVSHPDTIPEFEGPSTVLDPIPSGIPGWQGKIVNLKHASGKNSKTGKEWTRYTLVGDDGEEFNTFSASVKDLYLKHKGGAFQILFKQSKFGKDLEEIRPVEDEPPF